MVTPDDHRCADLAPLHQLVQRTAELCPLPLAQPADARGQSLERHPLLREPDPAMQVLVLGEELEHQAISAMQVARVARRSEEHTSELQSRLHLVCRLLLEKKKKRLQAHIARAS